MPRYENRDIVFDVPDNWEDRTVTAFAAPLKPGQKVATNIVMTRDAAIDNEPITSYADRQMVELAKRLDGFSLQGKTETLLDGFPAVELSFTWNSGNGKLQQKQFFVAPHKGTVMSFTITALKTQYLEMEREFDAIVESIRFPKSRY